MMAKAIPEFLTQSSDSALPLQSHHGGDGPNLSPPVHHLLILLFFGAIQSYTCHWLAQKRKGFAFGKFLT